MEETKRLLPLLRWVPRPGIRVKDEATTGVIEKVWSEWFTQKEILVRFDDGSSRWCTYTELNAA